MSGLVNVRYCRAPTKLLYWVASFGPSGEPSCKDNFSLAHNGVLTGLQFAIPGFFSRSATYLS
jgi:hypothetical protein